MAELVFSVVQSLNTCARLYAECVYRRDHHLFNTHSDGTCQEEHTQGTESRVLPWITEGLAMMFEAGLKYRKEGGRRKEKEKGW